MPSKYRAVRTGGYASKAEAARAQELRGLQASGAISELKEQVTFDVAPTGCESIRYRADFTYVENGVMVVHEEKGFETPEWRIKRKLFEWKFPHIVLRVTGKGKH